MVLTVGRLRKHVGPVADREDRLEANPFALENDLKRLYQ